MLLITNLSHCFSPQIQTHLAISPAQNITLFSLGQPHSKQATYLYFYPHFFNVSNPLHTFLNTLHISFPPIYARSQYPIANGASITFLMYHLPFAICRLPLPSAVCHLPSAFQNLTPTQYLLYYPSQQPDPYSRVILLHAF